MVADILDIGVKIHPPMFECFRVMSSHDLQIKYFQPLNFGCRDNLVELCQKAARENIFLEPAIDWPCCAMNADAVDDGSATGIEQLSDPPVISSRIARSQMFKYAN